MKKTTNIFRMHAQFKINCQTQKNSNDDDNNDDWDDDDDDDVVVGQAELLQKGVPTIRVCVWVYP